MFLLTAYGFDNRSQQEKRMLLDVFLPQNLFWTTCNRYNRMVHFSGSLLLKDRIAIFIPLKTIVHDF